MSFILSQHILILFFFFFNDTATTEIYTLSLHDALPISVGGAGRDDDVIRPLVGEQRVQPVRRDRSEEHTSELQSQSNLVCRLLLEKKKKTNTRLVLLFDDNSVRGWMTLDVGTSDIASLR